VNKLKEEPWRWLELDSSYLLKYPDRSHPVTKPKKTTLVYFYAPRPIKNMSCITVKSAATSSRAVKD